MEYKQASHLCHDDLFADFIPNLKDGDAKPSDELYDPSNYKKNNQPQLIELPSLTPLDPPVNPKEEIKSRNKPTNPPASNGLSNGLGNGSSLQKSSLQNAASNKPPGLGGPNIGGPPPIGGPMMGGPPPMGGPGFGGPPPMGGPGFGGPPPMGGPGFGGPPPMGGPGFGGPPPMGGPSFGGPSFNMPTGPNQPHAMNLPQKPSFIGANNSLNQNRPNQNQFQNPTKNLTKTQSKKQNKKPKLNEAEKQSAVNNLLDSLDPVIKDEPSLNDMNNYPTFDSEFNPETKTIIGKKGAETFNNIEAQRF